LKGQILLRRIGGVSSVYSSGDGEALLGWVQGDLQVIPGEGEGLAIKGVSTQAHHGNESY
jgi:hypothetical protein